MTIRGAKHGYVRIIMTLAMMLTVFMALTVNASAATTTYLTVGSKTNKGSISLSDGGTVSKTFNPSAKQVQYYTFTPSADGYLFASCEAWKCPLATVLPTQVEKNAYSSWNSYSCYWATASQARTETYISDYHYTGSKSALGPVKKGTTYYLCYCNTETYETSSASESITFRFTTNPYYYSNTGGWNSNVTADFSVNKDYYYAYMMGMYSIRGVKLTCSFAGSMKFETPYTTEVDTALWFATAQNPTVSKTGVPSGYTGTFTDNANGLAAKATASVSKNQVIYAYYIYKNFNMLSEWDATDANYSTIRNAHRNYPIDYSRISYVSATCPKGDGGTASPMYGPGYGHDTGNSGNWVAADDASYYCSKHGVEIPSRSWGNFDDDTNGCYQYSGWMFSSSPWSTNSSTEWNNLVAATYGDIEKTVGTSQVTHKRQLLQACVYCYKVTSSVTGKLTFLSSTTGVDTFGFITQTSPDMISFTSTGDPQNTGCILGTYTDNSSGSAFKAEAPVTNGQVYYCYVGVRNQAQGYASMIFKGTSCAHSSYSTSYTSYDASTHYVDKTCSSCGVLLPRTTASHSFATTYSDRNTTYHYVTVACSQCGYRKSRTSEAHSYTGTVSYTSNGDNATHTKKTLCNRATGCTKYTTVSETCTPNSSGVCTSCKGYVNASPAITTQPSGGTITYPATKALSVAASKPNSGATLSYQWQESTNNSSWSTASGTSTNASYTTPAKKAAGTYYYRVIVTSKVGTSTKTSTSSSATVTINKKTATINWGTTSWVYNKAAHTPAPTVSNLESGDSCSVSVSGSGTNVGSFTATLTALGNANYALPSTKTHSCSITAKEATISWGTSSWVYDKTAHTPTATVSNLVSGDACTVTVSGSGTNVGSFTATATALSNSNYKLPSTAPTKACSITAKDVTVSWGTSTWVYDKAAHTPTATVTNLASGDTCTVTVSGSGTDVGTFTATVSGLSNANYKIPATAPSKQCTITPKEVTVSWGTSSWIYDKTPHTPTASVTNLETDDSCDVTVSGSGTNVGSFTATVSGLSNANYKIPSSAPTKYCTITPKEATIEWGTSEWVYDSATHTPTASVTNLENGDTCTVTVSGDRKNVGTFTATATGLSNSNYKLPVSAPTTNCSITKKALSITANPKTITYGDAPANAGVSYSGFAGTETSAVLLGSLQYAYDYTQFGNVGDSYQITPSGLTSSNYEITWNNGKLTVVQRESTLEWGNSVFVYDGGTKVPAVTVGNTVNGDVVTATVDGAQVDAGSYTATATALSNSNYKLPAQVTRPFTINKANAVFNMVVPTGSGSVPANMNPSVAASGATIVSGVEYVFALGSGQHEIGSFTTNSTSTPEIQSNDDYKVHANLTGDSTYVVSVNPVGTTTNSAPVTVTVSLAEAANYKPATFTYRIYVSNGPVVEVAYDPATETNTDVIAHLTVTDPFQTVDSNHKVAKVVVNDKEISDSNNDDVYDVTFVSNANFNYTATDTLGSDTNGTLSVNWIDKEPPSLSLQALAVNDAGKIQMYAQASDNVSNNAELEYRWTRNGALYQDWTLAANMNAFDVGDIIIVTVRDRVGNETVDTKTAEFISISSITEELAVRTGKMLKNVGGDISGYKFAADYYMDGSGNIKSYSDDPITLTVRVDPASSNMTVEGYVDIGGARFPITWYKNEALTELSSLNSTDGRNVNLTKGKSYGVVTIDPTKFITRSARNATATVYLTTYTSEDCAEKIASETYTMTYSVDVTPPSIVLSYNSYSRQLDIRATDAISGVKDGKITYSIDGGSATEVDAICQLEYPTSGRNAFTITVTAEDVLGNRNTVTKTYTPSTSADGSGSGSGSGTGSGAGSTGIYNSSTEGTSTTSTAFSRSRLFNKYLINGTDSNANLSSVPQN